MSDTPQASGPRSLRERLGFLCGLLLLSSVLALSVKLFPVYVDYNFVSSIARSLLNSGNASSMSQSQIRQDLEASLRLNNIRDVDINDIQIIRTSAGTRIHIRYEKRVKLIGNIDLIVSFDEVIE
jgi:hypothetical protein